MALVHHNQNFNQIVRILLLLVVSITLRFKYSTASQDELGSGPYLDICENEQFRRIRPSDCRNEIFFEKIREAPACICLNGIWKLSDSACKASILKFENGTCFQNRVKRFQSFTYIGSYDPDKIKQDLYVILDIPIYHGYSLEQIIRMLDQPTRISLLSTVFVLNGDLFQRKTSYCVQVNTRKRGIISKYGHVQGDIVTRSRCFGQMVRALGHDYIKASVNRSECNLFCETPIEQNVRPVAINSEHKAFKRNIKPSDIATLEQIPEITPENLEIRQGIVLNRKMLQFSIERSFKEISPETHMHTKPELTHGLLDQLKEITLKACGGFVSEEFLERAIESLIAATTGLFSVEIFRGSDAEMIEMLLERCYSHSRSLWFFMDDCNGEIAQVRNGSENFVPLELPSRFNGSTRYHLVMDVTWNMVDLINAFCIGAFKSSYRMYHELEQGMEKLYSDRLRRFWANPDIPDLFYERLFGPEWHLMARNLEKCVEGAYIQQPRLSRLRRPTTVLVAEKFKRSYTLTFPDGTPKHRSTSSRAYLNWSRMRSENDAIIKPEQTSFTSPRTPATQISTPRSIYDRSELSTTTTPKTVIATTKHDLPVQRSGLQWRKLRKLTSPLPVSTWRVSTLLPPSSSPSPSSDGSYLLSSVMEITCRHSKCNNS